MSEYDKIAKEYTKSEKTRLERIYILDPSFIKAIGEIKNKTVLDLACGDGNFSRKMKKNGAKKVVGIDLSKEMIRLAKEKTKEEGLEIKYLIKDVTKLEKIKEFDLVIAAFLLHYSKTKEEISKMCKNIYKNLKKDGKFITLNQSPINPKKDVKEFGVVVSGPTNLKEGDKLIVKLYEKMKETCSFTTYHWSKETYESCLRDVGFKNIKWSFPRISKKGIIKYPELDWRKFIDNPYTLILEATK